jgi:hypothetical protein
MDGYEVGRRLRQMSATKGARIIAVSGYGSPLDRQQSQEAGFDRHMIKPVAPNDLRRAIEE